MEEAEVALLNLLIQSGSAKSAEIALSPEADLAATKTKEKVLLNLLVQSGSAKSHIEMFGKTSILRRL